MKELLGSGYALDATAAILARGRPHSRSDIGPSEGLRR